MGDVAGPVVIVGSTTGHVPLTNSLHSLGVSAKHVIGTRQARVLPPGLVLRAPVRVVLPVSCEQTWQSSSNSTSRPAAGSRRA
ncbi:MAG: hypothetical protein B6I33_03580 [Propionibacterium sp. 4572_24]|nr:MAG: hypothetical protein B6I33_03580 [Propionibacterium sp. 4572_24]